MGRIERKSLDTADEVRAFPHGEGTLVRVGSLPIGRGIFRPGWRWSIDVRPVVGTLSCEIHHLQILLSGRMHIEMDDGEGMDMEPGDVFDVPPGHDAWVLGDEVVVILDIYGNSGAFAVPADHERIVTTLLLSDIVDSTAFASRLGDAGWRQLLSEHNRLVRAQLARFRGREINTTGDGFLAVFPSAVSALRAATAICSVAGEIGLLVRVGVHTGEVEVVGDDVAGVAVHAVARIAALAAGPDVMVSSTTRSLVAGSGFEFEERGVHQLKGLDEPMAVWRLRTA